MGSARRRAWTLEAARALLPDVRARTAEAVAEVEALAREAERAGGASPRLEAAIRERIGRWAREMEAFGLEVKGLWLVDFDTGGGYLCWRWPEERLEWFHGYEDGFAGRTRIH